MNTRVLVATLGVATSTACTLANNHGAVAATSPVRVLRRFSPAFMSAPPAPLTSSQAATLAKRFDVIVSQPGTFAGLIPAMKLAHPSLEIYAYVNGAFSVNDDGTRYPASWYARDLTGALITSIYGNLLMDVSKPEWKTDVTTRCASFVTTKGYDGCFLDTLGTAIFSPGYVTSLPLNLLTGSLWAAPEWIQATADLASFVRFGIAPARVMANGLSQGTKYFDPIAPTRTLASGSDAGMVELFARAPFNSTTAYRSLSAWKADVDLLADSGSIGYPVSTVTKLWVPATQASIEAWHRYALASFLLGATGAQSFSFTSAQTWQGVTSATPDDYTAIGKPLGRYAAAIDGTYRRLFTNGIALVNPTTKSITVPLDGAYRTLAGSIGTSLTLAPHSGDVLVHA